MFTKPRGLSLIEVLVACGIFAAMAALLLTLQIFCSNATSKTGRHSDTYRMVMTALSRIKTELSPSRLAEVKPTFVRYKLPRRDAGGQIVLGYSGLPTWLPEGDDDHMIYLDAQNQVMAERLGISGVEYRIHLGDLGDVGQLRFSMPLPQLLEIEVSSEILDDSQRGQGSRFQGMVKIYAAGQT